MAIRVDAYTSGGMASGILARPGPAPRRARGRRDAAARWRRLAGSRRRRRLGRRAPLRSRVTTSSSRSPTTTLASRSTPTWHHIQLESGPYTVEGELATLPGFDPGRALTRPSGEFLMLRDVRAVSPGPARGGVAVGDHALVNRYAVERIRADLMLGFFFPGATVDAVDAEPSLAPPTALKPGRRSRRPPVGGPACDARDAPGSSGRDRPVPRAAAARYRGRG